MKIVRKKRENNSIFESKALKVKKTIIKAEVSDMGYEYSIDESRNSNRIERLIKHENPRSNFEMNGTFNKQFLKLDGNIKAEEIDIHDNPNEIFLYEDFQLDESDESACETEQAIKAEESSKFVGISKHVRARCSTCKKNFEKMDDNQLRYLRKCSECHSPLLFQCRKCAMIYKYFQSVWDHVKRSCKRMEIRPIIRELTLKVSVEQKKTSGHQTPSIITLDSSSENESDADFVNCPSTLPFRIESVESRSSTDDAFNDINDETPCSDNLDKSSPAKEIKLDESTQNLKKKDDFYRCFKCEFQTDFPKEFQQHMEKVHYAHFNTKVSVTCPKCRKNFLSAATRQVHQLRCLGKMYFRCKFCPRTAEDPRRLKNHLVDKHSKLFKEHELKGIMKEIKCKKNTAFSEILNKDAKKNSNVKQSKESTMVSGCNPMVSQVKKKIRARSTGYNSSNPIVFKVEKIIPARSKDYSRYDSMVIKDKKKIPARSRDYSSCDPMVPTDKNKIPAKSRDYSIYDITISKVEQSIPPKFKVYSNINELLKIRCCNCKINFDKVEEKIIVCCAKCHSELLYSCRSCNQLFAYFAKAWLHVSSKCKSLKDKNNIDPQVPSKNSKTPEVPSSMYNCRFCNYKAAHKWQTSQHMEMWHSCLNDDLPIKFTACCRCGLAFENPEECVEHEKLYCGKEMLLFCEFCQRVEARTEPMRIHLVKMHMPILGSLKNLENVMNAIKLKRQAKKGSRALALPNQRDSFTKTSEC